MADQCFKLLRFVRLRVGRLYASGVPEQGADNLYVTDTQISLAIGFNNEAGDDFTQKNGAGAICFSFNEPDKFKNLTLTLSLCDHSPELQELLVGGTVLRAGSDAVGYSLPAVGTTGNEDGVSIEGWTYNIDGSAVDSEYPYVRWVFPKTTWAPADKTLENNPIVNDFTGIGYENDNFHDGPANDWDFTDTSGALYSYAGDTTLPTPACGASTLVAS